jgi:ribosomal protein L11 methyltransferase
MDYFELNIDVDAEFAEILIAELAEVGFDSFVENLRGIQAYVTEENFDNIAMKDVLEKYATKTSIIYTLKKIKRENWNQTWEESFEPINVADKVLVRAHFHKPDPSFEHEIIITPKMSFGTGHHDTTAQIMEHQLNISHKGKTVLDVGTGTGILAILAEKLGATAIRAFDIDDWSVENTIENIELNGCKHITVGLGTINNENPQTYDIVIANINRNILLSEIPTYRTFMKTGAYLLLSGFYETDIADIEALCIEKGLKKIAQKGKNNWAAVVFKHDQ